MGWIVRRWHTTSGVQSATWTARKRHTGRRRAILEYVFITAVEPYKLDETPAAGGNLGGRGI